jgi:hypothetical protein
MRHEVVKLVTKRLTAEARCGLGQSELQERFAERLFYHCQRGTLSRNGIPHPADLLTSRTHHALDDDTLSSSRASELSKCK